jgi:hypothetical protein
MLLDKAGDIEAVSIFDDHECFNRGGTSASKMLEHVPKRCERLFDQDML